KDGVKGTGASVSCFYDAHIPSMRSVIINCKSINIKGKEWFKKASALSDAVDIFAKVDGTVQIEFTFRGITKTIGKISEDE
ncbi:MAG: hypothetical protein ACI4I5_00360, partial [Acutalibacteraceae bacterium]